MAGYGLCRLAMTGYGLCRLAMTGMCGEVRTNKTKHSCVSRVHCAGI
jgi:hypothetical protein